MSITKSDGPRITLVCFALKEEAAPFRRFARQNSSLRVVVTGMGKRNTESSFRAALEQQKPALVLTCGFAGGLDPKLSLGDVLYDDDPEAGLAGMLERLGAKRAHFNCAPRMIVTPTEKRALRESTGAAVVEMESHYIRVLCRERNIPSATIRVISDTANDEMPLDFNVLLTPDDRISFARLGLALLKSPGKIKELLAFQKNSAVAARNLARVLKELLSARS